MTRTGTNVVQECWSDRERKYGATNEKKGKNDEESKRRDEMAETDKDWRKKRKGGKVRRRK